MNTRLKKCFALAGRHKLLLAQAWFMLGWYRAGTLLVPFRRLTNQLQRSSVPLPQQELAQGQREDAMAIGGLVAAASRLTPWQSPCLTQVIVVQRLLATRNIPGQICLGVLKGEAARSGSAGLSAHAWLRSGGDVVNGASGHHRYTVVSSFYWGVAGE